MSTPEQIAADAAAAAAASTAATDAALRANANANMPRTRAPRAAAAPPAGFSKVVHAYRRAAHMAGDKEQPVEVEFKGEKAKFLTNEQGHVVATITSEALFKRLVKEIPEAYIEYDGGENIPARVKPGFEEPESAKFLLVNGENKLRLDDLDDEQLQEFAKANGVTVHEKLAGDDLRLAIFNSFQTS